MYIKYVRRKAFWMVLLAVFSISASMLSHAEWVEWVLDPTVELRNDSNVNLSAFSADEESDTTLRLALEGGRYYQMSDRSRLRLTANLEAQDYDEWDLLNSLAISGRIAVVHKLGLGKKAGWISPHLIFGYKDI